MSDEKVVDDHIHCKQCGEVMKVLGDKYGQTYSRGPKSGSVNIHICWCGMLRLNKEEANKEGIEWIDLLEEARF